MTFDRGITGQGPIMGQKQYADWAEMRCVFIIFLKKR